jgi:hypothetical protein
VLCRVEGSSKFRAATGNTAQDFNSLILSGSNQPWMNDTTVTLGDSTLNGWSLFNSLNAAITTYNSGTGSSNTGNFYSFGATAATERALGGTASGGALLWQSSVGRGGRLHRLRGDQQFARDAH